jgi:signal transduction histidine kinase
LLSNSIYQILQDPEGRFWLSGPSFISSVPADQMQKWSTGAIRHLTPSIYALPYGAEDTQMYGGRQPSGYVDPDGVVWFPSSKGALHVLLTRHSIAPPPRLVIEKVTLDGRELPLGSTVHLPSSMTRLEFQFAALSLRSQSGIRYRYKLENFDKGWIYAGTNLTASYTNLPSGHYRFVVNAFDVGDPSVVSQAGIDLRKDPVLWQRWWFLTLCLSTLCLGFWIAHRVRIHQVKLRFKAVLDERSRLAREMHDTVIQGCTSVSALLEAIASTQTRDDRPQDELLRYARAQVRTTIHEARQTVWNLRHEDSPLDLVASLTALAVQAGKESGVRVDCVTSGDPLHVAGPVTRELLMVVREAVYNAVRHGHAQTITICATFQPERLVVTVSDDGLGFQVGDTPADGHYGITGMRERMKGVGGTLKIKSVAGQGTQVVLTLSRALLNPLPEGDTLSVLVSADSNGDLRRRKPWSRR